MQETYEGVNEPAFLLRLKGGDADARKAYTVLVRTLHDRLLGYIRRQLGSIEESQEVLQEVFLAAHKGLANFEGKSRVTTWVYSLAHHKICDRIADRTRDRAAFALLGGGEGFVTGEADERVSQATAWGSAPDRVYARSAAERWIASAIAALKPPGCDVYHLRDVEGLSGEEVSRILGLSHAVVRVQLHRARAEIVAWVRARMALEPTALKATALKPGEGKGGLS